MNTFYNDGNQVHSEPWFDMRLNEECMQYLLQAISKENKVNWNKRLAGNISKSELIEDKDNWFYKTVLKKLTERMFYRSWENFSKYHIEVEEGLSLPEFEMDKFWVNYQKQHEFNPPHNHRSGIGFSFVVFMKIPTHWKDQHALPISANSNYPVASDFAFFLGHGLGINSINFQLSPEDEGRMLFFPAWLVHQVFPFYNCEEERVTISGNIIPTDLKNQEMSVDLYEQKEKLLEKRENEVEMMKKELKDLKKVREKEGLN